MNTINSCIIDKKCPRCGSNLYTISITTNPPIPAYKCFNCGHEVIYKESIENPAPEVKKKETTYYVAYFYTDSTKNGVGSLGYVTEKPLTVDTINKISDEIKTKHKLKTVIILNIIPLEGDEE